MIKINGCIRDGSAYYYSSLGIFFSYFYDTFFRRLDGIDVLSIDLFTSRLFVLSNILREK